MIHDEGCCCPLCDTETWEEIHPNHTFESDRSHEFKRSRIKKKAKIRRYYTKAVEGAKKSTQTKYGQERYQK